MRSDAAPRLSQAISPTWTGIHIWQPTFDVTPVTIRAFTTPTATTLLVTNAAGTEHFIRTTSGGLTGFGFTSAMTSGEALPNASVHAVGEGTTNPMSFDAYGASVAASLIQRRILGTRNVPTVISGANFVLGGIYANGCTSVAANVPTFASTPHASIEFVSAEAFSAGVHGSFMQIHTTPIGTSSRIPRLTIDNTGHIGIGLNTSAAPFGTMATVRLHVVDTNGNQLRIGRDLTNTAYWQTNVATDGAVTFDAVGTGSGPSFTFNDPVATGTTPVATTQLTVLSAANTQLRLANSATDYMTAIVSSSIGVTFDSVASVTPQFTFSDPVNITGALAVSGVITQAGVKVVTGIGTTNRYPIYTDGPNGVIGDGSLVNVSSTVTCESAILRVTDASAATLRLLTAATGSIDISTTSTGATSYTGNGASPSHTFNDAFTVKNAAATTVAIRRSGGGGTDGVAIIAGATGTTFTVTAGTAPQIGFVFKPSAAFGSGKMFEFQDDAGNSLMQIDAASKTIGFGVTTVAGTAIVEFGNSSSTISSSYYIHANFGAKWGTTTGSTFFGVANAACSGYFSPFDNVAAGTSMTSLFAGGFQNNSLATNRNHVTIVGAAFQAIANFNGTTATAHGNIYGWIVKSNAGAMNQTATNGYGGYIEDFSILGSATPATTNIYGLYIEEQKQAASTIKNGLFLASATAGYKALVLGSQSNWLAWESATTFSLNATTVLCKADFDISTKNLVTDTTTGTKLATATTQKLGFWNVAPVIQPAAALQAALTNSTGGAQDGTLVDVGIVFSQANINNNFTDIYALLDAIRTALVNTGIMKGAA